MSHNGMTESQLRQYRERLSKRKPEIDWHEAFNWFLIGILAALLMAGSMLNLYHC